MLDELQAASLLLLIVGHGFLIRGCFAIRDGLPTAGERITDKIEGVSGLLDEMNDLIHALTELVPSGGPPASAQTGSVMEVLLSTFLNTGANSPVTDGSTQVTQNWTDGQSHPPTLETENELDELSS